MENKTVNSVQVYAMDMPNLIKFAEEAVKSDLVPFKKAADLIIAVQFGKDLGISFSTAVNNILVINNRTSLTTKLKSALVNREKLKFSLIRDFELLYLYQSNVGTFIELSPAQVEATILPDSRYQIVGSETPANEWIKDKIQLIKYGEDRITEIEFDFNGRKIREYYKYSEAVTAGLAGKDNWVKHPKAMMFNRCTGRFIDRYMPHVTCGLPTYEEIGEDDNKTSFTPEDPLQPFEDFQEVE